jgi:sirohydrochlorin ferrochelatase
VSEQERPHRSFAVASDGAATEMSAHQRLEHIGVSPAVSAAYDLLADDGMPPEDAARMAVAAERGGRDPEAFARHLRKLRRAWRDEGIPGE